MIVGVNGFLGFNLRTEFLKNAKNKVISYQEDLRNPIKFGGTKPDIIFHLASNTDTLYPNDIDMFDNNIRSFLNVLDFAVKNNIKVVWASSSAIYGNGDGPLNAYAHSKLVMEKIAEFFSKKIPIVGLRFFNCFGEGEIQKGKTASMITQWAVQIKSGQQPKIFKEDPDNLVQRDHIYIKDVVKALKQAIELEPGIYDVGSGKVTSFPEVLTLVQESLKTDIEFDYIENKNRNTYQTFAQANLDWGFKPDYTLSQGITDYLKDF